MDPLARNLRRVTAALIFVIVMVVALFALQVQRVDTEHAHTDAVVVQVKALVKRIDADRVHTDVVACAAVNSTADGVGKLVAQLTSSTATSKQRTAAQKAATEQFYKLALADFPRCTSSAPFKIAH